jgi:hypothetical protein
MSLSTAIDEAAMKAAGEQSEKIEAPADADGGADRPTQQPEEKGAEAAPAQEPSEQLLSTEEYDKLKKDPDELIKATNRAFTRKTQELAEMRKQLEPFQELANAFESDPKATINTLAQQYGLAVQEIQQAETKKEAHAAATNLTERLKSKLDPELHFLADQMGTALEEAFAEKMSEFAQKEVAPLKQQQEAALLDSAKKSTEATMQAFSAKHPGWEKHEKAMVALSSRLKPEGMAESEYLETLFYLATKDQSEAEKTKQVLGRMEKSAAKSEPKDSGVNANRVAKAAPKFASISEAFDQSAADARAGIFYE